MTTHRNEFDEAEVRAWLGGPSPAVGVDTVAEALGVEADFAFDLGPNDVSDDWLSTIEDLTAKAVDAKLLPEGTLVWLTANTEGQIDGLLITREISGGNIRLCSGDLHSGDLIDDSTTTGIDCAVSTLSAVHRLASALTFPGETPAGMQEAVDAAKVAAEGGSTDEEIEALQEALELALSRWPEVDPDPDVEDQLDNVKDD